MKKNKLIRFKAYIKNGKSVNYDFNDPIVFLSHKDEVQKNKLKYSSPDYLTETSLLDWKELDNCNFVEKLIYKINIPKWLVGLLYAVILLLIGAWINSFFGDK
ncbi:MAG: hypothetical protein K0M40_16780 [Prolixibacteraceae bacterium]|nr:hypothetical protein [Prolixibacteraceae bacterium]